MKFLFKILLTSLIFNLPACNNDEKQPAAFQGQQLSEMSDSAKAAIQPQLSVEGTPQTKIATVTQDNIRLKDGSDIKLPTDKEVAVLYFVSPAHIREGKTSLDEAGFAHAGYLSNVMAYAKLDYVYTEENNAAMQTGQMTSLNNQCEHGFFKPDPLNQDLKSIVDNAKGKRMMVVASAPILNSMLAKLSGGSTFTVADTQNNDIFVVFAKAADQAEVKKLVY